MRLKKGDMVEVMNRKEIPDSWHVAEILSGNGHTYRLKYDPYPGMSNEKKVETVSRMNVRPCQPLLQGVEDFVAGEIVEVFYENTWKTAAVLNVLQGRRETPRKKSSLQKRYLVKLLGCSAELIVNGTNIRTKQKWQDNKWIMFENVSLFFYIADSSDISYHLYLFVCSLSDLSPLHEGRCILLSF